MTRAKAVEASEAVGDVEAVAAVEAVETVAVPRACRGIEGERGMRVRGESGGGIMNKAQNNRKSTNSKKVHPPTLVYP